MYRVLRRPKLTVVRGTVRPRRQNACKTASAVSKIVMRPQGLADLPSNWTGIPLAAVGERKRQIPFV
jgi:hypothetical protein